MSPTRGRLIQEKPSGPTLEFPLNPRNVTVTGGLPRYREIEVPGGKDVSEYAGHSLKRITFTLFLDGFPDRSVERECGLLEEFAKRRDKNKPPPDLRFDYGDVGGNKAWRIDALEWGDELRNADLQRVRQDVVITLIEVNDAEVTLTESEKHKDKKKDDGGGKGKGNNKVHTVKTGETLSSIAAAELGDASRWTEIAEMNDLRDPNYLVVGSTIRIPES